MSYSTLAIRFFSISKHSMDDALSTGHSIRHQGSAGQKSLYAIQTSDGPQQDSTQLSQSLRVPEKKDSTFINQGSLPKLPIPELERTCRRYLEVLAPLQTPREQEETKAAVAHFLKNDGPILQERLKKYATGQTSYIEQFCM